MRESGSGIPLACRSGKVCWQEISDEARRSNIEGCFKREFPESKYKNLSFHASFGDPGHQIAAYAQGIGADVIVMPSHGKTGIKRLLLGSVAERVLRLAHCTVLVLKHQRHISDAQRSVRCHHEGNGTAKSVEALEIFQTAGVGGAP